MNDIVLAADLGGTNLRMAAVSRNGEIHTRIKIATPKTNSSEDIVSVVTAAARECISEIDTAPKAVALAVPGTINSITRRITQAPNIPQLNGFDLVGAVRAELALPVTIENDANAAAIGENWLGASRKAETSIMVTLGTGVGGGIMIARKIVSGLDGTAGEIGHICVEPEGIPCGCGSHGCVEQYASATALVRMARAAIKDEPSISGSNNMEINSALDVFEQANCGAGWAKKIFRTQGYYLGIVLAGLINCLNPEVIVIGGGAAAAWERFMPSLQEQVQIRAYDEAVARAKIVPAALGDNAGILGAARLGFEKSVSEVDVVV